MREVSGEVRARLRGVYALFDPLAVEPIGFIEALLRGGIRIVQIRAKAGIDGATLIAIVTRVRAAGGIAILNDDVGLARLADGVHLGQEDAAALDMPSVRRAFGPRIIGLSCGTPQEARDADPTLFDYVAAGPLFATTTKEDAGLPIGISGARAVVEATTLPCAVSVAWGCAPPGPSSRSPNRVCFSNARAPKTRGPWTSSWPASPVT